MMSMQKSIASREFEAGNITTMKCPNCHHEFNAGSIMGRATSEAKAASSKANGTAGTYRTCAHEIRLLVKKLKQENR